MGNFTSSVHRKPREKAPKPDPRLIVARNQCIEALAELPDPVQALAVVQAIEKSILEFIALRAR